MIKVLFFGQLTEQLGVTGIEVLVDVDINVSQLIDNIIKTHPKWAQDINHETVLVAVDQIMAKAGTLGPMSCEVAFFPPVTGG